MENKLEQLLNSLIQRGWKPYGFIVQNAKKPCYNNRYYFFENCADGRTLRELVSKESLLWQFVCENGMIPKENHERVYDVSWGEYGVDCKAQIISREPEYRLIESSLKDESELEDFLLSNIKVEGEGQKHS